MTRADEAAGYLRRIATAIPAEAGVLADGFRKVIATLDLIAASDRAVSEFERVNDATRVALDIPEIPPGMGAILEADEGPFPRVRGRCPACGRTSLFLAAGGFLTCSSLECPRPAAASDLIDELKAVVLDDAPADPAVWTCTIGEVHRDELPNGSDAPFRQAVERVFRDRFDRDPDVLFSGWGGRLSPDELRELGRSS